MASGADWETLFVNAKEKGNAQAIFNRLEDLENSMLRKEILSRWIGS